MNTNPDETMLALWLDGELREEQLREFEAVLRDRPDYQELLRKRDGVVRWKSMVSAALPASKEPPYPDFFNSRIASAIQPARPADRRAFSWRSWLTPLAACAGMALAFWLGARSQPRPVEIDVTGAPKAIPVEPVLYTPDSAVEAKFIAGTGESASAVVLKGVDAIPDDEDFSETAAIPDSGDLDATVDRENELEQGGAL
jgi:hypothetical protein